MDVKQNSALNHWHGIWPGTRSLLGLYIRRVWISAKEFKFQGGQVIHSNSGTKVIISRYRVSHVTLRHFSSHPAAHSYIVHHRKRVNTMPTLTL